MHSDPGPYWQGRLLTQILAGMGALNDQYCRGVLVGPQAVERLTEHQLGQLYKRAWHESGEAEQIHKLAAGIKEELRNREASRILRLRQPRDN